MPTTETKQYDVQDHDAAKIWDWLMNRGGIAEWRSINLSNLSASWTTPANDAEGNPCPKPSWQCANEPVRIITDPADVQVTKAKVAKRFHVAIEQGDGMSMRVTDGGSRKIRAAVAKAGDEAWYEFDYGSYDNAVILVPDEVMPIADFMANQSETPDDGGPSQFEVTL
jgi:hypothetical protein